MRSAWPHGSSQYRGRAYELRACKTAAVALNMLGGRQIKKEGMMTLDKIIARTLHRSRLDCRVATSDLMSRRSSERSCLNGGRSISIRLLLDALTPHQG
jgi:EAL domain-containing protein (putative c-di-GMP-specific phosphodiesterase class I)